MKEKKVLDSANRLQELADSPPGNGSEEVRVANAPENKLKEAAAAIEAHKQARVNAARQELSAIMEKYQVSITTRQVHINGVPQNIEILLTPNG